MNTAAWQALHWDQHSFTAGKVRIVIEGSPDSVGYKFRVQIGTDIGAGATFHAKVGNLDAAKAVAVRTAKRILTEALAAFPA